MIQPNPFRTTLILSLFSGFLFLAGCQETPAPTDTTETQQGSPKEEVQSEKEPVESKPETDTESQDKAKAIEFTVVTPEEYQKELAKYEGKVVFVDFWATWCINCIKGMKDKVELSKKYKDQGLVIIMMCLDENSDEVKKRASDILVKRECFFPSLMAENGETDEAYKQYEIAGQALPHYKLYGRDGKLIQAFVSDESAAIDHEEVVKKIEEAIQ